MHDDEALRAHLPGQMLRTIQGAETLPIERIHALLEAYQIDEALLPVLGELAQAAYLVHRADRSETTQTLKRLVERRLSQAAPSDASATAPAALPVGNKP
jgi:hypothetical protein